MNDFETLIVVFFLLLGFFAMGCSLGSYYEARRRVSSVMPPTVTLSSGTTPDEVEATVLRTLERVVADAQSRTLERVVADAQSVPRHRIEGNRVVGDNGYGIRVGGLGDEDPA